MKSIVTIPPTSTMQASPRANIENATSKPCLTPLSELELTNIVMLGHSYVTRFKQGQLAWLRHIQHTQSFNESINLDGLQIDLKLRGQGGCMIHDMTEQMEDTQYLRPQIVILELAQNDLCWKEYNTQDLAQELYEEALYMFDIYERLELVVVCQVLKKSKFKRGDKELKDFNKDVDTFNYTFLNLTRDDTRIARWTHKGLQQLTKVTSTDGTHPNTIGGYWQYQKSISACCKFSKREMILRRGKSMAAIHNRRLAVRGQRKQRREAKKLAKKQADS